MSIRQYINSSVSRAYRLGTQGFPFMPPFAARRPMTSLRAVARSAFFADRPWVIRLALQALMTLAWPFGAVIETIRRLFTLPQIDRPQNLIGWIQRGLHMMSVAIGHNIPPNDYVAYRLHLPSRQDWIADYLYDGEQRLCSVLNRQRGADDEDVQDKGRFADICRRHGFPPIPTLAVFENGQQRDPATPYVPDQSALFSKDLRGFRGSGQSIWSRDGCDYVDTDGNRQTVAELLTIWRGRDCIVQPVLTNHPQLDPLSTGGLVDLRMLTGIDRDGHVSLLSTITTAPVRIAGEIERRLYMGVELSTGRLQLPIDRQNEIEPQPELFVPFWSRCVELVTLTHANALQRFVFLGWDVAITPDGPILVEANAGWGAHLHQMIDARPLGHTGFAEIAASHLQNLGSNTPEPGP